MREQAVSEIDAERQRALGEVRAQVADLALLAAGKVVGETHDRRTAASPGRGVPDRGDTAERRVVANELMRGRC